MRPQHFYTFNGGNSMNNNDVNFDELQKKSESTLHERYASNPVTRHLTDDEKYIEKYPVEILNDFIVARRMMKASMLKKTED